MDLRTLARAYDRSAAGYDERFREFQRPKYQTAARLLVGLPPRTGDAEGMVSRGGGEPALFPGRRCLDAGGGTGLFAEFAPGLRVVVLDASIEMLRVARARGLACVLGDLAAPPFPRRSFPLVVSFTAVLGDVPRALRALGDLVAPGGQLVVSFLADEAPTPEAVARDAGLTLRAGPVPAGQDHLFHATR